MTGNSYNENLVWYVKWTATILVLVSVAFRFAGTDFYVFDLAVGGLGSAMWLWVSILWNDRALIILNTVMFLMLFAALLKHI
jgi:hypothetical protein